MQSSVLSSFIYILLETGKAKYAEVSLETCAFLDMSCDRASAKAKVKVQMEAWVQTALQSWEDLRSWCKPKSYPGPRAVW